MTTIQIPDSLFAAIQTISERIKNQDRRGTADPYLYELRDKEEVPCDSDTLT
jgi:hypothetical protein